MLLHELTGYKSIVNRIDPKSLDPEVWRTGEWVTKEIRNAIRNLIDKEELQTAGGSYAAVIISPKSKKVFKIWLHDSGFENYLRAIIQNQGTPGIPKVGKLRRIKVGELTFNVLPMEKLKPIRGVRESDIGDVQQWAGTFESILAFVKDNGPDKTMLYPWPNDLFRFHPEMKGKYKERRQEGSKTDYSTRYEQNEKIKISFNEIKEDFPKFYNWGSAAEGFVRSLNKSRVRGSLDLHIDNVMMRDNGEYVITDPFGV
ncbi:MAG: hypothetical protein ACREAU_07240 [Nitrosopumilaceae archaeon]